MSGIPNSEGRSGTLPGEAGDRVLTKSFVLVVSATFAYFVAMGALLPAAGLLRGGTAPTGP